MQYVELMVTHLPYDIVAINWFDFWRTIYIQNKLACDIFSIISEANYTFNEIVIVI